ncbi:MAG: MarR family winged helix-turn-helix transcriptional regulator [Coriobacteriia bacterium]
MPKPVPPGTSPHDAAALDFARVSGILQHLSLPVWLKIDVSMAQLKALVVLEHAGNGITVTELGKRLEIGESSASLLAEQLVKRGYAERVADPDDRRRVRVSATASGSEVLRELRHGRRRHLDAWLAEMDESEVEALALGLAALSRVARQRMEKE